MLPLADLPRGALHSKTSFVIRLKKFRVAVIRVLPVPGAPLTARHLVLAQRNVIAITRIRFPYKYLIYKDKVARSSH